jgi:hypothetical protein
MEFQPVIVRLHVFAQFVEGPGVLLFLQVRQFVHDNHPEEICRSIPEYRRDPDFMLCLEPSPLHP